MARCEFKKQNLINMKTDKDIDKLWHDIKKYEDALKRKQEELTDLIEQLKPKQCDIHVVSNRISDSGLRELYRKGYNDGFDNKADKILATDLIDKRIERIKKNYGC